jgi:hypothetical protein
MDASRSSVMEEAVEKVIDSTDMEDWQREIEMDELSKVGPSSIMFPYSARKERVLQYFEVNTKEPSDTSAVNYADEWLEKLIPPRSLRALDLTTAFKRLPRSTSWGLPFTEHEEYLDRALDDAPIYPAILGWRGQQNGPDPEDVSQRVVWEVDHSSSIVEKAIQDPVLEVLKLRPGFRALVHQDFTDRAISEILNLAVSLGLPIHSLDQSRFDARFPLWLNNHLWDWWASRFDVEGEALVRRVQENFQTMGLVVPFEVLEGRRSSIPSGTAPTNQFGGVGNGWSARYCGKALGTELLKGEFMGDDGCILYKDIIQPDELSEVFEAELGMVLNEAKGTYSFTGAVFLQYWYEAGFQPDLIHRGFRSALRMIGRWIGYERFRRDWNKFLDSIRVIMTTETCKWNPAFLAMVALALEWDDVLREMDPRDILKRAGGAEQTSESLGVYAFPFTDPELSGFDTFKTVLAVRQLQHQLL